MSAPRRLATLAFCLMGPLLACTKGTLDPYGGPAHKAAEGKAGASGQAEPGDAADGQAGAGGATPDKNGESAGADAAGDAGATGAAGAAGAAGANGRAAIALTSNEDGEITRDSNSLGIQGTWAADAGADSSLELTMDGSKLCMTGTTALVPELDEETWDYENYWGAAVTIDICHAGPDDDDPDKAYSLSTCPWSRELADQMVGLRFTVEGTLPRELRVQFREQGRETVPYVPVTQTGEVVALFEDALVRNQSTAALLNPSKLEAIEFYFFPSRRADWPFEVCIDHLEALTGEGWEVKTVPDWALEAGPGKQVEFAGVNLAGAEFGSQNVPGVYGSDYIYPGTQDVDIYADVGMNIVRLPFMWERLQPTLGDALDATELGRIDDFVAYANERGMTVIIDPHNFARYADQVVGVDVDVADFADLWGRLAERFADNGAVIFGLMNEPHDMETEVWLEAANAAIAAIRETGARQLILVPGNGWTGAHNWTASYYGTPNSVVMAGVVDPGDNFAFELHQYLDADSSGGGTTCESTTIGVERLAAATQWLTDGGYRGFLGEFGAPANDTCLRAMDELLTYVGERSDIWMGWAVWAGGPWWGESPLSVQPLANGDDRPQMAVLKRHLTAP